MTEEVWEACSRCGSNRVIVRSATNSAVVAVYLAGAATLGVFAVPLLQAMRITALIGWTWTGLFAIASLSVFVWSVVQAGGRIYTLSCRDCERTWSRRSEGSMFARIAPLNHEREQALRRGMWIAFLIFLVVAAVYVLLNL